MPVNRYQMLALLLACLVAVSCESNGRDSDEPNPADGVGQGDAVTTDPAFEFRIKLGDSGEMNFPARQFAVYQAKPGTEREPEKPQGWELRSDGMTLGGRLPAELKFAPSRRFAELIDQPLTIREYGGDPTAMSMSKLKFPDGKVYLARSGNLKIDKAFFRKDQYAGVSGTFDVTLQEIKLGDPDDPNNQGDQPVGEPIKATGSFTARADSYPYESL